MRSADKFMSKLGTRNLGPAVHGVPPKVKTVNVSIFKTNDGALSYELAGKNINDVKDISAEIERLSKEL